jgi:uncharacterized membrane protein
MLAVYPANINMAVNAASYPHLPKAALWARLPFQGLFIYWLYERCLRSS